MPLKFRGDLVDIITEAFFDAFPTLNDLQVMVLAVLEHPLNRYANIGVSQYVLIGELCQKADAEGLLEQLIIGAHARRPGNPKLGDLHQDLLNQGVSVLAGVSRYERAVLSDDTVFFDRKPFREKLEKINTHEARRILVVKGGEKCGKSYSDKLIRLEAKECQYNTISIKLKTLPKKDGVEKLAMKLARRMKPDVPNMTAPEQGTESGVRWAYHPLMDWTLGWMQQASGTWWIIFDEFDQDLVSNDVYQFLVHLASAMEYDVPNCRMAMLGFDQDIPPEWDNRHRLEEIADLELQHLEDFFKGLFLQRGLQPEEQVTKDLALEFFIKYEQQAVVFSNDTSGEIKSPWETLNEELKRFADPALLQPQ